MHSVEWHYEAVTAEKPREIAVRLLCVRDSGYELTERQLENDPAADHLSPADRRFLQEVLYGTVRWLATLDWLIEQRTHGRPPKPPLRNLLRTALYQLLWMDRVPNHALVNESVVLAKKMGFHRQSGFINGVLRNAAREIDSIRLQIDRLRVETPWIGWSCPRWLWTRWVSRWGAAQAARLMAWNNTPPPVFARVNTLRTSPEALLARWKTEGVEVVPFERDWLPPGTVSEWTRAVPPSRLPSFQEGGFYIQDPSTLLAVHELDSQPGDVILDRCAAPGGKTVAIAERIRNQGRIVAQDHDFQRLTLVQENCLRLQVTCVELSRADPIVFPELNLQFDRILVDAPCSNTGVLRRRVDLRWRIQPPEIDRLRGIQLEILNEVAPLLKPGGTLVYSTCSLEPEENEEVVTTFLQTHPELQLRHQRLLLPFADGVDGAYVARLVRGAGP